MLGAHPQIVPLLPPLDIERLVGFFRASLTPESVRSSSPPRLESFTVTVPADKPLEVERGTERDYLGMGSEHLRVTVTLPPDVEQSLSRPKDSHIKLPEGEDLPDAEEDKKGNLVYSFPAKCTLRVEPVPRWDLALVIAISVAGICLWGTLIGSMLPLIFKRLGVDPGIASSPFVATFVDVTGIVIYFSVARLILAKFLA